MIPRKPVPRREQKEIVPLSDQHTHESLPLVDHDFVKKPDQIAGQPVLPDDPYKAWRADAPPFLAISAILICLFGVMDLTPRPKENMFKRDGQRLDCSIEVANVSDFYGPGTVISWYLFGASLLYDANKDPESFKIKYVDWAKWLTFAIPGIVALGDAVIRAYSSDFGPQYAAALYMSDKAFELATLFYCVKVFGVHRKRRARKIHLDDSEWQRFKQLELSRQLPLFPCLAMVALWGWCRGLSNGHEVCFIRLQEPTISWGHFMPWYMKIVLSFLCFVVATAIGFYKDWDWQSWSLPAAVLASFAIIHSGLFGTLGAFRLSASKWNDLGQIVTVCTTIGTLTLQYGVYWWRSRAAKARQLANISALKEQEGRDNQERRLSEAPNLHIAIPSPEAVHRTLEPIH